MRLRYELLGCALHGHDVVGTDAATVRDADALVVREDTDRRRWHRCLRCDAWEPHDPPAAPARDTVPGPDEIVVPLRGKLLRDRFVLRLIALDRVLHVLGLGLLGIGILVFLAYRSAWSPVFTQVLVAVQGAVGGPVGQQPGLLLDAQRAFDLPASTLRWVGLSVLAYAALEAVEAVGLWFARRWAEYLTFVATTVLFVPEVYELAHGATPTKVLAFAVNVAVVVYLLLAKRLFGIRGGGHAEAVERARDTGWAAIELAGPPVRA